MACPAIMNRLFEESFSNRYGKRPLVLASMTVGHSLFGLWREVPVQPVLFQGQERISIVVGSEVVSDPVSLQTEAFSNLVISFLVAEGDSATWVIRRQMVLSPLVMRTDAIQMTWPVGWRLAGKQALRRSSTRVSVGMSC